MTHTLDHFLAIFRAESPDRDLFQAAREARAQLPADYFQALRPYLFEKRREINSHAPKVSDWPSDHSIWYLNPDTGDVYGLYGFHTARKYRLSGRPLALRTMIAQNTWTTIRLPLDKKHVEPSDISCVSDPGCEWETSTAWEAACERFRGLAHKGYDVRTDRGFRRVLEELSTWEDALFEVTSSALDTPDFYDAERDEARALLADLVRSEGTAVLVPSLAWHWDDPRYAEGAAQVEAVRRALADSEIFPRLRETDDRDYAIALEPADGRSVRQIRNDADMYDNVLRALGYEPGGDEWTENRANVIAWICDRIAY